MTEGKIQGKKFEFEITGSSKYPSSIKPGPTASVDLPFCPRASSLADAACYKLSLHCPPDELASDHHRTIAKPRPHTQRKEFHRRFEC